MPRTHDRSRSQPSTAALIAALLAAPLLAACSEEGALADGGPGSATSAAASTAASSAAASLADAPLSEQRAALLDLAFDSVTKMPVMPHVKDRSRAQEAVVETCLELDQPQRAARFIESIDNWRRGTAYAALADACAEKGAVAEADRYLALAQQVAETPDAEIPDVEGPQGWRRDRVRAGIARTHLRLGRTEAAAPFEAGLGAPERGEVEAARATRSDSELPVEQLGALTAASTFEDAQIWLRAATELYGRRYDDAESRARIRTAIEANSVRIPRQVRIELQLDLAEAAVAHGDRPEADALLAQARTLIDEAQWDADDRAALVSRLALLRHRAGDAQGARAEVDGELARFEQDHGALNSLRQARALRPLSDALTAMGAAEQGLALYRRVVELGADNPNARPRAQELSATCCSMARYGAQPDAALWARMQAIGEGLSDPW